MYIMAARDTHWQRDFPTTGRSENICHIGVVIRMFIDSGESMLMVFILPFREERIRVSAMMPAEDFTEIHCHCELVVSERCNVKELYAKARQGTIKKFTGIFSPYGPPESPELVISTRPSPLQDCVGKVLVLLKERCVNGSEAAVESVA